MAKSSKSSKSQVTSDSSTAQLDPDPSPAQGAEAATRGGCMALKTKKCRKAVEDSKVRRFLDSQNGMNGEKCNYNIL